MAIDPKLVDELLAGNTKPEQIIGENGLLKQLTKAILEPALNAELNEHLGYGKHDPAGYNSGNSRNGTTKKKLKGDFGEIDLETPRDRNGGCKPEPPKLLSPEIQSGHNGIQVDNLSVAVEGVVSIQQDVPPCRW